MGRLIFALLSSSAAAVLLASCSGNNEACLNASDCLRGQMCVGGQCLAAEPKNDDGSTGEDAFVFPDVPVDPDLGVAADVDKFPDADIAPDAIASDAVAADALPADVEDPDAGPGDAVINADAADPDAADLDAVVNPDAVVNADAVVSPDAVAPDAVVLDTGVPPPCMLDSECMNADLICQTGACVLRCDRPGATPCGGGSVCNPGSGRCVPGNLPLGADCSIDVQCQSLTCLGLTIGGTARNVCSQPCGASSNCPLQFSCLYLSGMNFCLGENLFTPPADFDVAAGGACSSGSITCQSGWCNTQLNQCIETCSRASDCAGFGGNCWTYTQTGGTNNTYDHLCLAQTGQPIDNFCFTNNGCQTGICNRYTSTCGAHCCRDSDCPAAQSCGLYDLDVAAGTLVKICGPRATGAGNQAIGATCTMSSECESEVCALRSLSAPAGPMQCSSFCCSHADCSMLPNGRCEPFDGPVVGTVSTIVGVCVNG